MDNTKMTMQTAVDAILEASKDSALDENFVQKMHESESIISRNLGITDTQSMLMALYMEHIFDNKFDKACVFNDKKCLTSRKLELLNDIDYLVENRLLLKRKDDDGVEYYKFPREVIQAFQHNEQYKQKEYKKESPRALFFTLDDLFKLRKHNDLTFNQLLTEIERLFDVNKEQKFVSKIQALRFSREAKMLFILFCSIFVNEDDDNIRLWQLEFLYDEPVEWSFVRSELCSGGHILFRRKFIENAKDGGFVDKESFKLTDKAKHDYLGELKLGTTRKGQGTTNIIKHKDIKTKQLYFPLTVDHQVQDLMKLLKESNYKSICQRMKKKHFHSGFTCLFYGTPGTGKTETVYQLAKSTGRDVMLVDIPQIRSMWVGESEKNVKGIFQRYASLVKESRRTPILLFNEADAIISKRTINHDSSADKMENTMQNIILQEMEDLNGILIATTNLQANMDTAFERRFLYKIQFDRPDAHSRAKIWHSMIPELDMPTIMSLANKYDFSGGQIENIARHYTIETILKGEETVTLETLNDFCQQESIKKDKKRIGFNL